MQLSYITILLALALGVFVSIDLARTLRTGRARGRYGTITRAKRLEALWRYWAVLALCIAGVIWMRILPGSFH